MCEYGLVQHLCKCATKDCPARAYGTVDYKGFRHHFRGVQTQGLRICEHRAKHHSSASRDCHKGPSISPSTVHYIVDDSFCSQCKIQCMIHVYEDPAEKKEEKKKSSKKRYYI